MTDNFMDKIATAMGMEIGDKIDLYDLNGDAMEYGPYTITDEGIVDCKGDSLSMDEVDAFFAGRFGKKDVIAEKLCNIEEKLDLMDADFKDIADEIKELKEQIG